MLLEAGHIDAPHFCHKWSTMSSIIGATLMLDGAIIHFVSVDIGSDVSYEELGTY